MRYRDPSILLRIAMADAAAAGAEYIKLPRDADTRELVLMFDGYVAHPTHGHSAGQYTDDAEMSIACAEVLAGCGEPFVPLQFADAWVREFNRGGRRKGYSQSDKKGKGGFQGFLEATRDGAHFLEGIFRESDKNGAIMRAAVFGVLPTVSRVLEAATVQAAVTHNTPPALFSARAAALMAHFALYGDEPLEKAGAFALANLPREDVRAYGYALRERWDGRPVTGGAIPVSVTTAHAAATLVMNGPSLMAMLRRCIEWGGDTDSVAAVAWGIASPRFQDEQLPDWMERDLEFGSPKTGAPHLRALGERLMARFD